MFVTQSDVATISYPTQGAHNKNRMLEQNHSHFLFTQGTSEAAGQASRYQYELSIQRSFGKKLNYSAATYMYVWLYLSHQQPVHIHLLSRGALSAP